MDRQSGSAEDWWLRWLSCAGFCLETDVRVSVNAQRVPTSRLVCAVYPPRNDSIRSSYTRTECQFTFRATTSNNGHPWIPSCSRGHPIPLALVPSLMAIGWLCH
ncbi:hypothetical protein DAEQUDRAFT_35703 [Daedalea quercina L-15889]|uniref:Uncharacterized protein n=1 Tax=Daedalea quercina L-15889 TaxID=1314783 RepID=A0A165SSV2_9APHY|nr:hypothetical protein DAEQUDRAFT_35703 [Daedalea quercina L-15889]